MNRRPIPILLALAALAVPATSIAAPPAVTQYTIVTPTSKGPKQIGAEGEASLNPQLARGLRGNQDLRRLVSTPGLGAVSLAPARATSPERPGFAAGLWDGIGGSPMIWLVLGLAAGTVALVVGRRAALMGREPAE